MLNVPDKGPSVHGPGQQRHPHGRRPRLPHQSLRGQRLFGAGAMIRLYLIGNADNRRHSDASAAVLPWRVGTRIRRCAGHSRNPV